MIPTLFVSAFVVALCLARIAVGYRGGRLARAVFGALLLGMAGYAAWVVFAVLAASLPTVSPAYTGALVVFLTGMFFTFEALRPMDDV